MPKSMMIEEFHITVQVPNDLPETQAQSIRDTLTSDEFLNRLRRAVRSAFRALLESTMVRVSLTR